MLKIIYLSGRRAPLKGAFLHFELGRHLNIFTAYVFSAASKPMNRKKFITSSVLASTVLLFMSESCKKELVSGGSGLGAGGYSFGTGDIALLNFAYVLSQVQAAFYVTLLGSGIITDSTEQMLITDMLHHETAQREFFNTALGSNALGGLQLTFSSIDFTSRSSALSAAIFLEDLCVRGLNGAAVYMQSAAFLTILAQVISVQARHASYIHEIVQAGTFTGPAILDQAGMEKVLTPAAVLAQLQGIYIKTQLNAGSLPAATVNIKSLPPSALTILDFALRVKLFKLNFYQQVTGMTGFTASTAFSALTTAQQTGFLLLATDEQNQTNFLTGLFTGTAASPATINSLTTDLTANQLFADIATNPVTLLLAAQVIEDTSVRYFKGQLARLAATPALLRTFLNIHSVDARHASYVRLSRLQSLVTIKPWIETINSATTIGTYTGPAANATVNTTSLANVYINEDNTVQAQIQIVGINGHKELDTRAASASFDEVLSQLQVRTILLAFVPVGI